MGKSFTTGIDDWCPGNRLLRNLEEGSKVFGSTERYRLAIPRGLSHRGGVSGLIEHTKKKMRITTFHS